MLAKRLIPCLDVDKGRVVKGVNFVNIQDAGDPVEQAKIYDFEEADELVFLDITASHEERDIMLNVVRKTAVSIFMPFTVGGGIRSITDFTEMLNTGADKVSINTSAVKNPGLISSASSQFGAQCVVVAIDAKRTGKEKWNVYINGGRTDTGIDAVDWAKKVENLGAGEILLTSMERDGTTDGFDIPLTYAVSTSVKIPVIASGGAGHPDHFVEVFTKTRAAAGLAASIFHYKQYSISEVKNYLIKKGIQIRPPLK